MRRGGRFAILPGRAYRDRALTPKLRDVLGAVAYYANSDGHCIVRLRTVATLLDTDYRNLRRYVDRLEDLGYLSVKRRDASDGREIASEYLVIHDAELPADRDRAIPEPDEDDADYPGGRVVITPPGGQSLPAAPGTHDPPSIGNSTSSNNGSENNPPSPPSGGAVVPIDREAKALRRVPAGRREDVLAVFDAWCDSPTVLGRRRRIARLDGNVGRGGSKRTRADLIAERLADAWPVEDLADAVRGWVYSPHHRGENDSGTTYDDLTLLLRDAGHIERFRDLWRDGPPRQFTARDERQIAGLTAAAEIRRATR